MNLVTILVSIGIALGAIALGLLVDAILTAVLSRWESRRPITINGMRIELKHWRGPSRALIPAIFLALVLPTLQFPGGITPLLSRAVGLWIIAGVTWFSIRTVQLARDMLLSRYEIDAEDNLQARRVYTQIRVGERVLIVLILIVAISAMLMTFDSVRQLGVSILASAGVAGLIIGFAAQRSLGMLFAGIQLAISQPIRLDDVVIIEGEWGTIEDITLTYVVVRIWDQRRLVVPVTYFIEQPFQNWTRTSAELLGTVYLYVDYTVPVEPVRDELKRILDETPLWDRQVWNLQITDATERVVELRALMSASDSSRAWDLRCHVREELIKFLQTRYPRSLPRVRIDMSEATPVDRQDIRVPQESTQ